LYIQQIGMSILIMLVAEFDPFAKSRRRKSDALIFYILKNASRGYAVSVELRR
jgi:hypothetical protein